MSDPFEEPEGQMAIETTQSDFIYFNPLLGVSDAYIVYSQALGVITGTLLTEDTHRAILALIHLSREIIEHDALKLEKKTMDSLKKTTKELDETYYGTEDSGYTYAKLRSRKRALDQEKALIWESNVPMEWDAWIDEYWKAEKEIFGKDKPFPKLIATLRAILNNRITRRVDIWRDIARTNIALITPKSWDFKEIIDVKYVELEEEHQGTYKIPSEIVFKGMEFSDSDKKIQFTRFGVDPYYNLQRCLTEMVNESEYLIKIFHFSQAFKSLESPIQTELDKGTYKVTRLRLNKDKPVICPNAFIKLMLLLKKLNRLLSMDRLTLIERLELEDLRTEVEVPIISFMSTMSYIFQEILAHNPHLARGRGKPEAKQY